MNLANGQSYKAPEFPARRIVEGASRMLALLLLMVNGFGAIYGGYSLMLDPTGQSLQLPLNFLESTPFSNYFFPGVILFFANGVFSLAIALLILIRASLYRSLVIFQGCILVGWIVVQMAMVRMSYFLDYIFGGIGIALIILGFVVQSNSKKESKARMRNPVQG